MERLHDTGRRGFASDNHAGVHPEVLDALATVNGGHVGAYGADPYTAHLQTVMHRHFGEQASCWPVFNGTGANVVALSAMTDRWDAVIATGHAHIHTDECGAPEKVAGIKVVTVPTADAIMTPALLDREARGFGFEHHAQPRVVSLTQSTEVGTVHSPDQVRALADHAHALGMLVHVDGARIANAAAALGVSLREITTDCGVDVLSLGGTKAGLMGAEAVVVLDPGAVRRLDFVRKLSMQLGSKMRFLSAQLVTLYDGDLWLRSGERANAMARRLGDALDGVAEVRVTQPVAANAVFATIPPEVTVRLQARYPFYVWDEATGEVRLMCSWDTTEADVDGFVAALREELGRG
ncbi:threonine aldolase family protein [Arsenicicoccus dermatophilus]|uniref:threonine aldolase family protein n=1 Tax=Arsenicicoccus dermatophilus TaxID=1076331 RepID=UPI0039175F7D